MSSRLTNKFVQRGLFASKERFEFLFTLLLLLFAGVFLWKTFGYEQIARIIPLAVLVPTCLFLCIVLLTQTSSRFNAWVNKYKEKDVFAMDKGFADQDTGEDTAESQSLAEQRVELATISAWILVLTLVFYFIGIKIAIAAFLLGYYYFQADQGLTRAIGYSAGVWLFIYIVFEVFLGTPL